MKLFNKTNKNHSCWNEKTAPKNKGLVFVIETSVLSEGVDQYTFQTTKLAQLNIRSGLISRTDDDRGLIKDEIAQIFEEVYEKICKSIDSDSTYLTDGFWANTIEEKQSIEL